MTQLDDSKNTGKHTHTPIPEYKEALTTAGHKIKFVNEVISGLETSDLLKNCPACVASSVVQPPNPTGNELDEILDKYMGFPSDYTLTGESTTVLESAKSKLTKYIEQQVLIGRIDEVNQFIGRDFGLDYGVKTEEYLSSRQITLKAQLKDIE